MRLFIKVDSIVTPETADREVFIWVSKRNWFCINYATTGLENSRHFFLSNQKSKPIRSCNYQNYSTVKIYQTRTLRYKTDVETLKPALSVDVHTVHAGLRNRESCPFTNLIITVITISSNVHTLLHFALINLQSCKRKAVIGQLAVMGHM